MIALPDRFGRPLRNLRLSVTDRCNLRCQYCMPEEDYVWLPKSDVLTFEEILRLVDVFTSLGRRWCANWPRGRPCATSRSRPTACCCASTRRR
jgi:hypothetical protein